MRQKDAVVYIVKRQGYKSHRMYKTPSSKRRDSATFIETLHITIVSCYVRGQCTQVLSNALRWVEET
jgi:hypothetical protein